MKPMVVLILALVLFSVGAVPAVESAAPGTPAAGGEQPDTQPVPITMPKPSAPQFGPDTLFVAPWGTDAPTYGTRSNPYQTIQYALDYSAADNVIFVFPGTYNESIYFSMDWAVELRSEKGPDSTIIDGSGLGQPVIFSIGERNKTISAQQELNSVLDGFTITCPGCSTMTAYGGIEIIYQSPVIRNNKIIANIFDPNNYWGDAGGIHSNGGSPEIYNNVIAGNRGYMGGGIYLESYDAVTPLIYNNLIYDNAVGAQAAGIYIGYGVTAGIYNNTIYGNTFLDAYPSPGRGAGIYLGSGNATIRNNIIAFNRYGYGVYNASGSVPVMSNTLLYGNGVGDTSGAFAIGPGMVHADPLFVDATGGDFRLSCYSPAIDGGDRSAIEPLTAVDMAGNPRVAYKYPDQGALEFIDDDKLADFSASVRYGCRPLTVSFVNASTCIDEQWLWDFGDGWTDNVKNPTHRYLLPGLYTVTLRAIGDFDSDTIIKTDYIRVYDHLAADFSADTTFGCTPFSVKFTPSANDSVFAYSWNFGDGGISTVMSPSHTYTIAGRHTVRLIVTNTCGPDTVIKTGYIYAQKKPSVRIASSYDSLGGAQPCNPFTVRFHPVAAESLFAFAWDFGDNSKSTERDPEHTYTQGKTYSVELIATGLCDTNRTVRSQYITLRPRPTATPRANTLDGCAPLTVNFTADTIGSIQSFKWYFGDGDSASTRAASHIYTVPGKYAAKLVFTHTCGADTAVLADSIIARDRPSVSFSCPEGYGYAPFTVNFADNSANQPSQWAWEFGDGQTADTQNPTHQYAAPGLYDVALTASNACGSGTRLEHAPCVTVAGYELLVGQPARSGDTTVYPLVIDTVLAQYPNTVTLSAAVQPAPYRGSLATAFSVSDGVPPFGSELRFVPSGDLPSGVYTISIAASDPIFGYEDRRTVTYEHAGQSILALVPDTLNFDSVETGVQISRSAGVANTAAAATQFALTIQSAQVQGQGFTLAPIGTVTLPPDSTYPIPVRFLPTERREYRGTLRITTNDPVVRDTVIILVGRGIPEQTTPKVAATAPNAGEQDALINSPITIEFTEPVRVDSTDTTVTVRSWHLGHLLPGTLQFGPRTITFTGDEFWPPYDSVIVHVVADRVRDTVYNRLDGDKDGLEEGSPIDDFEFVFVTGPGVYPGDADDNREVDERDVLPLGRFWDHTGPQRPLQYETFSIQPARQWPDSAATYADADGNGIIDSMDVCPILEFWSAVAGAPLAKEQAFLNQLAEVDGSILRAIYQAIDYCPAQSAAAVLKGILAGWLEQAGSRPSAFELSQNYPNPFNARTVITYTLPAPAEVEMVVYNIQGEKIAVLAEGTRPAGRHVAVWDGRTSAGEPVASGMYFCRLKAGQFRQTRKMALLK